MQVADQRLDKSKVSSKKNGYGMEMAPITAAEDVAVTVRKAIEQELQARGFALGSDTALVKFRQTSHGFITTTKPVSFRAMPWQI